MGHHHPAAVLSERAAQAQDVVLQSIAGPAGGASPHSRYTSVSTVTTRPASTSSDASSSRSLAAPIGTGTPSRQTSSGPRSLNS